MQPGRDCALILPLLSLSVSGVFILTFDLPKRGKIEKGKKIGMMEKLVKISQLIRSCRGDYQESFSREVSFVQPSETLQSINLRTVIK